MRLPHGFSHGGQCAEQVSHHKGQEWPQQGPVELWKHHIGKQILQSCSHPLVYIPNALSQLAQQHIGLQKIAKSHACVLGLALYAQLIKSDGVLHDCGRYLFSNLLWVLLENLLQAC